MEHRWNIRTPIQLDIVVEPTGKDTVSGRTRNLSFGGAFVETNPVAPVNRNSMVKVLLPIGDDTKSVSALVVRTESGGIGLMFTDFALDTISELDKLLRQPSVEEFPAQGGRSA